MPQRKSQKKGKALRRVARVVRGALHPQLTTRRAVQLGLDAAGLGMVSNELSSAAVRGARALNLFGDRKSRTRTRTAIPAGFVDTIKNATWSQVVGPARSRYAGSDAVGIRVRGSQPLCGVVKSAAGNGQIFVPGVATVTTDSGATPYSYVHVCPHGLGGPLLQQSLVYQYFAIRKMKLTYVSATSTATTGMAALAYLRDPVTITEGGDAVPTSFDESREVTPSVSFPWRADTAVLSWTYNGEQLWFCDPTTGLGGPEQRQCNQGQIVGWQDSVPASSQTGGYINMDYEIDFLQPAPTNAATLVSRTLGLTRDERKSFVAWHDELKVARAAKQKVDTKIPEAVATESVSLSALSLEDFPKPQPLVRSQALSNISDLMSEESKRRILLAKLAVAKRNADDGLAPLLHEDECDTENCKECYRMSLEELQEFQRK